jgi:hypothetical protein
MNSFDRSKHNAIVLKENGLKPNPCYNAVCTKNLGTSCEYGDFCHRCLFQMTCPPPNQLDYAEPIPSHREALELLEFKGELSGPIKKYEEEYQRYQDLKIRRRMFVGIR